ncbi:MAG TPA: hypothetical protein PLP27_08300 [Crocinitomicaceae bacterium]|nr:hypothetical protein [Crocinitomicaceae bacterium]
MKDEEIKIKQIKDFDLKEKLDGKEMLLVQNEDGSHNHVKTEQLGGAKSFLELSDTPDEYPEDLGYHIPVYINMPEHVSPIGDGTVPLAGKKLVFVNAGDFTPPSGVDELITNVNNTDDMNTLINNSELIPGMWYKIQTDWDTYNPTNPANICEYAFVQALTTNRISTNIKILRRCVRSGYYYYKPYVGVTISSYISWGGRVWTLNEESSTSELTQDIWDPLNPNNNIDNMMFDPIPMSDNNYYEWVELDAVMGIEWWYFSISNLLFITEPRRNNKIHNEYGNGTYGISDRWRYSDWTHDQIRNNTFQQCFINVSTVQNSNIPALVNCYGVSIKNSTIKGSAITNKYNQLIDITDSEFNQYSLPNVTEYFSAENVKTAMLILGYAYKNLSLYKLRANEVGCSNANDSFSLNIENIDTAQLNLYLHHFATENHAYIQNIKNTQDIALHLDFDETDFTDITVRNFNNNGRITNGGLSLTPDDSPYQMPFVHY